MYDIICEIRQAREAEAQTSPRGGGKALLCQGKAGLELSSNREAELRSQILESLWVRLERTYTMELTHVKHRLYRIPT